MLKRLGTWLFVFFIACAPVVLDANASPIDLLSVEDQNLSGTSGSVFLGSIGNDDQIAAIENAVDEFRTKSTLTQNGVSKLELFYRGIIAGPNDPRLPAHFMRWRELFPNSPTPIVLEAHVRLAGVLNSFSLDGFSKADRQATVPKRALIDKLRAYIVKNHLIAASDPHWYLLRLRLSLIEGQRGSHTSLLLAEALDRFPRYKALYAAAADIHLPRWGGSADALELWAREVDEKQQQKNVLGGYALTYLQAFENEYGNDLFVRSNINWDRFEQSWQHLERDGAGKHFQAIAALVACVAGDHAMAKRLFKNSGSALYGTIAGSRPGANACVVWAEKTEWQLFVEETRADLQPYLAYVLAIIDLILLRGR
ncbi:MAG: hypothetical protein RIC14_10015 [Filomicrobium sp.]